MNNSGPVVKPCLPSNFDRFGVQSISHKPRHPTPRSWVLVQNPPTPDAHDLQKCATDASDLCPSVHPEGSVIHYTGCVVSNQPVDEPLEGLGRSLLEQAGLDRYTTAFVMPDRSCIQYYLVNHSTKTVLWVGDDVPSTVPVADPQRVQNMLHEEYWMHMENFPAPVPAFAEDLQQLKVVLASLAVDSSTSDGSTSPFSTSQIQEFLAMLNVFSDKLETYESYTIVGLARLWSMIWHARVVNNFGANGACLDRFTPLSNRPPSFSGPHKSLANCLVGAGADMHLLRCSRAWAGRIAYVTEWRKFKANNEQEWKQAMYLACVLIIASLLTRGQTTFRFMPNIVLALACTSVAASYHLISQSQNLGEQAADASVYFQHWETAQYGVQNLALWNAMPRALLVWGFLVFLLSMF
ncbi:hypothetical protein FRC12_002486 [Ceratobasidium sp. 428]|nr:hypothetical protein FRC12_002486 [Ceratobasidium sp. 428]